MAPLESVSFESLAAVQSRGLVLFRLRLVLSHPVLFTNFGPRTIGRQRPRKADMNQQKHHRLRRTLRLRVLVPMVLVLLISLGVMLCVIRVMSPKLVRLKYRKSGDPIKYRSKQLGLGIVLHLSKFRRKNNQPGV